MDKRSRALLGHKVCIAGTHARLRFRVWLCVHCHGSDSGLDCNTVSGIFKYRWSLASLVVTLGTAVATLVTIQYLYRNGLWQSHSQLGMAIAGVGGVAVLVSFVLAVVALFKNEPPQAGLLALLLSLASVALYTR